MSYIQFSALSPHFDLQPAHERLGLLVHHSVLTFQETIARMLKPESKIS